MEQLLAHLVGDYVFHFGWLARQKCLKLRWALLHGLIYSLPFLLFCHATIQQVAVIAVLHGIQDHWLWKTVGDGKHMKGLEPAVTIVRDNTLHMLLNWVILGGLVKI
jgi:hypothetical protein